MASAASRVRPCTSATRRYRSGYPKRKSEALERPVLGSCVAEVQLVVDSRFEESRTAQQERLWRNAAAILKQDGVQKAGSPKAAPQQAADQLSGFQIQLAHRHVERIVQQG